MSRSEDDGYLSRMLGSASTFRRRLPSGAGWLIVLALSGCTAAPDYLQMAGPTMGTQYRVTARCPGSLDALNAAVTAELLAVNASMSTYDPHSELSRFNSAVPGDWFAVSAELAEVVAAAIQISEESGGAFDVTVGPLVNLWGFGPPPASSAVGVEGALPPDNDAVEMARGQVGYEFLSVRQDPPALRKARQLYVDLSAIAKGHGVDRLARLLEGEGCTDFLVDVGGEVRVRGVNPNATLWRVGVELPEAGQWGGVQKVLALSDRSVATSGDYRNFVEFDNHRYSHTIDPRTGAPVEHALASVTVVHASTMLADAYATTLNVLGPADAIAFAEQHSLAVYLLIHTPEGIEARYTRAMSSYLVDAE